MEEPKSNNNEIMVSVVILTYFHEKYLEQAIESVLNQKTNFRYEIIVSDDASMDGTVDIIKYYEERYPHLIRGIYNKENIGIPLNKYNAYCSCKGQYITCLDGDDYWISDNRLKRQIDILKNNSEYYGVCCRTEVRFDDDDKATSVIPGVVKNCAISLESYLKGQPFSIHGLLFKNDYLKLSGRDYYHMMPEASRYIDDSTEVILILKKGVIYQETLVSDVYRIHRANSKNNNYNSLYSGINHINKTIPLYNYIYYHLDGHGDMYRLYKLNIAKGFSIKLDKNQKLEFKGLLSSIPEEYKKRNVIIDAKLYSYKSLIKKNVVGLINALKKRG